MSNNEVRTRRSSESSTSFTLGFLRRIADLLFLTRPVLLGPVWVIYGAGAVLAGSTPGWDLFFVSLMVAGVYVHNQIADIESDRANNKLFLLSGGYVGTRTAWALAVILWLTSLAWAATEGSRFLLYVAALVMGLLYNKGVFVPWKQISGLGLLTNAVAHGTVTFLAGYTAASNDFQTGMILSIPYTSAVAAIYLGTTMMDRSGDSSAGKVTWAVRFGPANTAWLILVLIFCSATIATLFGDLSMTLAGGIATVPAILLVLNPSRDVAERVVKIAVTALTLTLVCQWYGLIGLAAVTFIASRLYHRWRFGMRYPSFGVVPRTDA
jgi:4-hydroxybenzoate polyprenyltransferase